MSSSQKPSGGSSDGAPKSVRFSSQVEERIVPDERQEEPVRNTKKRPSAGDAVAPFARKKRPRLERPNPDEEDDVDDWEPDEGEEGMDDSLPDSKELLQAKRERRLKREGKTTGLDEIDEDETHLDAETSLLSENKGNPEIPIEAFNMDAERTDGSGYFEGDTYVFRKRDMDEEPDAWLDSLNDDQKGGGAAAAAESSSGSERDEDVQDDLDRWTREDLYAKMIPLVGDKETVLQAVSRYGALLKRTQTNKNNNVEAETAHKMAQKNLNDLTEAANALLLKGDVDVYQQTKVDMVKVVSDSKDKKASSNGPTSVDTSKPVVQWEYRGNQDDQIHGPFSTQQMTGWIRAGYFIGPQAVQIRTVSKESPKDKSTVDDLLSDLMDDDEAKEAEAASEEVRGEWQSSNDVNFAAYS